MTPFEDATVGAEFPLGSHLFTAEDIKRFARAYDPQPFHLDERAAEASHFGGLCASGWHTAAIWMRLMADHMARDRARREAEDGHAHATGPSPGFEDLRWLRPVFAGDTIRYSCRIVAKRRSATRPEWGLLTLEGTGVNQDDEPVLHFRSRLFVEARDRQCPPDAEERDG